jgi:hypothetical protein
MSATGIVIRQAIGTPTTDQAWLNSPDILVYPGTQPGNTNLFTTPAFYATGLSQAPLINGSNYIYVRGQNAASGAQTSTVYLFSADHNPRGSRFGNPSQLLVPSQWQSANFTVNGKAQNSVSITASAQNDIVLGASPLVWTPPPMANNYDNYCLIVWVDNTSDNSNPPPFSSWPQLNSLDDLVAKLNANPNMAILDTSHTSGMFMRQFMGQSYNVSQPTNTPWQASPDIAVYAGTAQYDLSLLQAAPNWAFHQMPQTGQGKSNNIYVRGYSTASVSVTARISFYYVEDNQSTGANNPLLSPQNWKTDSFTYNGTAQNFLTITGASTFIFMTNSTPLVWSPPTPDGGTSYCLIAWIDNTNGSNPPPFANLPAFTDVNALSQYIEGQRSIVAWDTASNGLFARQFPGQTVSQTGTGAQTSPDIIVTGPQAIQDASTLTTQSSYNSTTLNQNITLGERNFIYLRVLNPQNVQQSARVYLYYATTATISPPSWSSQGFTVAGMNQNWVDMEADTLNQVLVTTVPVVWVAPSPQSQYILIAYVDTSENPQPPDFSPFGYTQVSAITQFVSTQPQLVWLSLTNTVPAAAPTMSFEYPLPTHSTATQQYVGIQLKNIPADGTVSISIPGPDAADTIINASMRVPDPNAAVVWAVSYPANFQNSLILNYWKGNTLPPGGANITLIVLKS